MAFTKFAVVEDARVIELKSSPERVKTASLDRFADFHDYRTEDGYLYARIWAISSRVNKNNDGWPSKELAGGDDAWEKITSQHQSAEGFVVEANDTAKHGYSTFLGKPIFVDHHNSDPDRARGVIVDARLHVNNAKTAAVDNYYETAPANHHPPTRVELLLEIDAKAFPKFAQAVIDGARHPDEGIDGWSMGCDVDHTVCSICSKVAYSPDDYCTHVQMKGAKFPVHSASGERQLRRAYEDCYGIGFFEISGVFDPADETALSQEVRHSSTRTAEAPLPQADLTKAPDPVNTLREDKICPVCGSEMDGPTCEVCNYEEPPESFQNPDLERARELQEQGQEDEQLDQGLQGEVPQDQITPESLIDPDEARKYTAARKVISEMAWTPRLNSHVAGRINTAETPAGTGSGTNEPDEQIVKDEDKPTTASATTAGRIVEAAETQETPMSDSERTAAEPVDAEGKAKKRVDVEGTGGVDDASNEQASKAEKQVDVEGKGGTGVEDVSADRTESVEKEERIQGTPTDTWHGTEGQTSPVTDAAYPGEGGVTSAKKGVEPGAPEFKADERVNVEEQVNVEWRGGDETKQWTGTDGNGVTRQQNPVTTEVFPPSGGVTSHVVSCIKLADTEVDLGITPKAKKYDRIAELQIQTPGEIEAQLSAYDRVRTAGHKRIASASNGEVRRLPTLGRRASTEEVTPAPQIEESIADASIFSDNLPIPVEG